MSPAVGDGRLGNQEAARRALSVLTAVVVEGNEEDEDFFATLDILLGLDPEEILEVVSALAGITVGIIDAAGHDPLEVVQHYATMIDELED